jgi:hypothetical protein
MSVEGSRFRELISTIIMNICSSSHEKVKSKFGWDATRNRYLNPLFHVILPIMADVEMKPAEEKIKDDKKEEKKDEKKEEGKKEETKPPPSPVADIKSNIALIERAVSTLEPRFTHRVLRTLTSLRKRIDDKVLRDAIEELYPKGEFFVFEM